MAPKILIVDDDEDLHTIYSLYLRSENFDIKHAFNGKEALTILEAGSPDLIVLDMIMPVMDGEEFFTYLRTEKKDLNIPVIIASVNEKIPQKMFDLGNIYTTMKKPFTIDLLLRNIQTALLKASGKA